MSAIIDYANLYTGKHTPGLSSLLVLQPIILSWWVCSICKRFARSPGLRRLQAYCQEQKHQQSGQARRSRSPTKKIRTVTLLDCAAHQVQAGVLQGEETQPRNVSCQSSRLATHFRSRLIVLRNKQALD